MKYAKYPIAKRGDLYYANLGNGEGTGQAGICTVVCIQNNLGNRHGPTTIIAPVTAAPHRHLPTHVEIHGINELGSNAVALLERVRTLDKSRLLQYITSLGDAIMDEIDEAIKISLGLKEYVHPDEYEICLCSRCASQYYNMPDKAIRRVDDFQEIMDTCDFCQHRKGYNYKVWPIIHMKGGEAECLKKRSPR